MNDRNGARVCEGDRVLVFYTEEGESEPIGYAVISRFVGCSCSLCDGRMVAMFVEPRSTVMRCASPNAMELPVAVAVARRRKAEARHDG